MPTFQLNPELDLQALAQEYAANRRLRIHRLLADQGLRELYYHLAEREDWWHLINTPDGVIELDRETRARMSAEEKAELEASVNARAETGFQYRYEGLSVPEDADTGPADDMLTEFAELMSSAPMLDMLRAITGYSELSFTDGFVTAYGPGDFLTGHDDDVEGKDRLAAYVFGLTPRWRLEWGGLLLFHGADEASVTGHMPRFNTLDLFAVPQRHSVSMVTPAATARRYAITGWLRKGSPPQRNRH